MMTSATGQSACLKYEMPCINIPPRVLMTVDSSGERELDVRSECACR